MKKLISLALICGVLVPSSAMALKDGAPKAVWVGRQPAGIITPFFLQQLPGHCEYTASWDTLLGRDSGVCDLFEARSVPNLSCSQNLYRDIDSFIHSGDCWGVDTRDRVVEVDMLVAGESEYTGELSGTICFSYAPRGAYTFKAVNY